MTNATAPTRTLLWLPPAALAAACAPMLVAYNVAPSATLFNQAFAVFFWGLLAAACAVEIRLAPQERQRARAATILPGLALAILIAAAVSSHLAGPLPRSLALSAVGILACAAVLLAAGAHAGALASEQSRSVMAWFAAGWLLAGLLSAAIAFIQVLAPQWADGTVIARSWVGRAIGNMRQPNHLCTLLLWAAIATVALQELRGLHRMAAGLTLMALSAALVLSASRTAVLGVAFLAAWGLIDRRLARPARISLLAMPVLYAASWAVLSMWARATEAVLGAEERLTQPDLSSSRFGIWSDALELIRQHPWGGVGFGEFNFAWTLSVLPNRPVAFFDHAHNILVHWAVELGLPATAVLALLLGAAGLRMILAVWRAHRSSTRAGDEASQAAGAEATLTLRVTVALLALMLLHSLLEYPLWYAYFLLPTAWLLGFGLAQAATLRASVPQDPPPVRRKEARGRWRPKAAAPVIAAAGLACAVGAVLAVADYRRVAAIYDGQSERPLEERLDQGLRSPLFAHQAAYAVATISSEPEQEMEALHLAAHNLLDTRLMMAWAKAYAASGDLPRAHYLVARLREFHNPAAAEFFKPCTKDSSSVAAPPPFQCQTPDPRVALSWTHFR